MGGWFQPLLENSINFLWTLLSKILTKLTLQNFLVIPMLPLNYFAVISIYVHWHYCSSLGATSIEKIPKISASGRNFLDPLPPLFEKGPYRWKRRYFVPNSNYKVQFFFEILTPPPPISPESQTSLIFTIEVAP